MPTLPTTRQDTATYPEEAAPLDPGSLAQAFESFTQVAGSLESSYEQLQAQVAKLRCELETTNRELSRSLAENESIRAYLGRILEGLPCGVIVVDTKFSVRFANPEARRMFGSDRDSPFPDAGRVPENFRALLAEVIAGKPGAERVCLVSGPEGARAIEVTCASLPEDAASQGDLLFILRDITDQRRLERDREFSRRMQALAEMTALLAHEIRNPLGSLELFAGLIRDATGGQPEVGQWIVHLQAGLRALSATVNNVLQFHTQAPPQTLSVNVGRLLHDTVEFLQPLALQRGMGIKLTNLEKDIFIPADPHRLQQVFFNIAINAFRAMSPGGFLMVRVTTDREDASHVLRIDLEDQGKGIFPEHLGRIFDAGFTTSRGSPGLGLAVSKRVVEQHGGSIQVHSVPGSGTTFTLRFPVRGTAA